MVDTIDMSAAAGTEPTWDSTQRKRLKFASWNIRDGRNGNLEAALHGLFEMKTDLAILTETKFTGIHTQSMFGYRICASVSDGNKGGIAVAFRDTSWWHIEDIRFFGNSVVSMDLYFGEKAWTVIGGYLAPSEIVEGRAVGPLVQALDEASHFVLLLGDFNINFEAPRNEREDDVVNDIANTGKKLIDVTKCFRPPKEKGRWTWEHTQNGEPTRSKVDYCFAEETKDVASIRLKQPRYCNTDHRCYVGEVLGGSRKLYGKYRRKRSECPIPFTRTTEADKLLAELKEEVKTQQKIAIRQNSWISAETWRLFDKRRQAGQNRQWEKYRDLKKETRRALREDRKKRNEEIGGRFENAYASRNQKEAYREIRGWYKRREGVDVKPSEQELKKMQESYKKLFTRGEIEEPSVPIITEPFKINDDCPTEEEIRRCLKLMKRNKTPGASGIKVEHLQQWAKEADYDEEKNPTPRIDRWKKIVRIVEIAFTGAEVPEAFTNAVLVLIPKSKAGEYRGIALLEVIYKLCTTIITQRIQDGVEFHDCVHGFRRKRGTSTAIIETKLRMQLAFRQQKPYYQIFLDLTKAYDTIDRSRMIDVLRGYGVGNNTINFLRANWRDDKCVPRRSGFYGEAFRQERGVRQGDGLSPVIFNVAVDAVVRAWLNEMSAETRAAIDVIFYADDGRIGSTGAQELQQALDELVAMFTRMGLKLNAGKTKVMISCGGRPYGRLSDEAYHRMMLAEGPSYQERQQQMVNCEICGEGMRRRNYNQHYRTEHGRRPPEPRTSCTERFEAVANNNTLNCPVPGCPAHDITTSYGLRRHFNYRHPAASIKIIGDDDTKRCPVCKLFVPVDKDGEIPNRHKLSKYCEEGKNRIYKGELKILREAAEAQSFHAGGELLERVSFFKYLGRWLEEEDDDNMSIDENIKKARKRWNQVHPILARDGANARIMARAYVAVLQAVLLYASETWVISERAWKKLESFHRSCARRITRRFIKSNPDGSWTCPDTKTTLSEAGLFPLRVYIERRRKTIQQYIQHRPIFRKCLESKPVPTAPNKGVWWQTPNTL